MRPTADLTETDLTGADLSNADATSATFRGARLDHATKLDNTTIDTQELARAILPSRERRPAQSQMGGTYRVETCPLHGLEETLNRGATQGWSLVSVIPDVADYSESIGTEFVVVWVT
ncbi:MAG: pentapeptide repeat-containing protein [Actinomycetota bacterium]